MLRNLCFKPAVAAETNLSVGVGAGRAADTPYIVAMPTHPRLMDSRSTGDIDRSRPPDGWFYSDVDRP